MSLYPQPVVTTTPYFIISAESTCEYRLIIYEQYVTVCVSHPAHIITQNLKLLLTSVHESLAFLK
ncbi:hypothetical protein NIES4073_00720 (plasmid) [Kalymmatonema gypsitolerans NIES-4073]|nr:hypothetical protein NIES4073_00720 [Scytonema sp. NIES-4073]